MAYRQREPVRQQPPSRFAPSNNSNLSDQQIRTRQQMAHVNVVTTQPGRNVWDFEHPWSHELCSCADDMKQCCFAFCCPCCFECKLYKRAGESIWTCMCPGANFALRSKIRTAFRIQGDLINDCCVTSCCPCCSSIQVNRELAFQGL